MLFNSSPIAGLFVPLSSCDNNTLVLENHLFTTLVVVAIGHGPTSSNGTIKLSAHWAMDLWSPELVHKIQKIAYMSLVSLVSMMGKLRICGANPQPSWLRIFREN
jgi:hypothetical protein